MALDILGLHLTLVPLTRPDADPHQWANVPALLAQPCPQGGAGCPGLGLSPAAPCLPCSWLGWWDRSCPDTPREPPVPGDPPAPQHPDTGRLSFPILLPCRRISTLNANTSTCLPNLLLQTVLMPGTTRLPCKREIPKRMEKGIFHFEMEFCFDNFISLMLRYCKILESLDCRIIAVSNKSNKNVSCAYVVTNVTQGPWFIFLVLVYSYKGKPCTCNSSAFPQSPPLPRHLNWPDSSLNK